MSRSSRLILAVLATSLALWAAAGAASARRFEVNTGERGFRVTWAEYHILFGLAERQVSIKCPVTVEGSFHSRTLAKVSGTLIGYITRATVNEAACVGEVLIFERERVIEEPIAGKFRLLTETLPWHVRYVSFQGTLPRITRITVSLVNVAIRAYELPMGAVCLYRSTAAAPMKYLFELNELQQLISIKAEEAGPLTPKSEGGLFCSETMSYEGLGSVTQLGSTARITVRLVA